jgi:mRNA-degrading endonuclease RelE of RelBE toxin-antitoxin system
VSAPAGKPYQVNLTASARRALTRSLPESVGAAVCELLAGPLAHEPHRVGKQPLMPPLEDFWSARRGDWRVIYTIDDATQCVVVHRIDHRRDAYRT